MKSLAPLSLALAAKGGQCFQPVLIPPAADAQGHRGQAGAGAEPREPTANPHSPRTSCPPALAALFAVISLALVLAASSASADTASSRHKPPKLDRAFGREDTTMKATLRPVVAQAARSTVKILVGGQLACLGTAVHADGYLVTKSSELESKKEVVVEFAGGLRVAAKVLDRLEAYDLALLKVDASGLTPIQWSEAPAPIPGSFLAAVSPTGEPSAIGVASVGPRSLYEPPKGFLGVRLRYNDKTAAIIDEVYKHGAAADAGLVAGDVVLSVETAEVKDCPELVSEVSRHHPGDEIAVKIRRGADELDLRITLMDRHDFMARFVPSDDPMVLMSGRLSNHRHGFFNVFQHDLVLQPEECGGPLIDLDGHVVGLDIARSGRVESLAIPAADLKSLLAEVTKGHFCLPDVGTLRDQLKKADLAILEAQEKRVEAEHALERAKSLAETVQKPAEATARQSPTPAPESMPPTPTAMPARP